MSSIILTIKSNRVYADLARFMDVAGNKRNGVRKLKAYLKSVECGAELAAVTVQKGSAHPVAAAGTLTLTYASMQNNDTVTLAGVVLTGVVGTPAGAQFKIETDGTVTAVNLAAAINANATLVTLVVATSALSVVTLTALQAGVCGNQYTLVSSRDPGVTVSAAKMAGGTGGALTTAITYSMGL